MRIFVLVHMADGGRARLLPSRNARAAAAGSPGGSPSHTAGSLANSEALQSSGAPSASTNLTQNRICHDER